MSDRVERIVSLAVSGAVSFEQDTLTFALYTPQLYSFARAVAESTEQATLRAVRDALREHYFGLTGSREYQNSSLCTELFGEGGGFEVKE